MINARFFENYKLLFTPKIPGSNWIRLRPKTHFYSPGILDQAFYYLTNQFCIVCKVLILEPSPGYNIFIVLLGYFDDVLQAGTLNALWSFDRVISTIQSEFIIRELLLPVKTVGSLIPHSQQTVI